MGLVQSVRAKLNSFAQAREPIDESSGVDRVDGHGVDRLLVGAVDAGPVEALPAEGLIRWEDCILLPDPCAGCGGLMFWWNFVGDRRCMTCDSPTRAIRLLERAEAIRHRQGNSSPAGAAETLADLRRLDGT